MSERVAGKERKINDITSLEIAGQSVTNTSTTEKNKTHTHRNFLTAKEKCKDMCKVRAQKNYKME